MDKKLLFSLSMLAIVVQVKSEIVQSLSFYADKCNNLKIGAEVGSNFYDVSNYDSGSTYELTIRNNYNILVAENEMKFDAMEPTQGNFNYTKSDKLVAYAQKYNKQVRGHNLCWHSQLPYWISSGLNSSGIANGTFTRASLLAILKNHIMNIMGRYKGKIQQWDVVNEPFSDSNGVLRNSIWQQVIGNDYIDSAFVWAHQADPTATLYLNEYGAEYYGGTKSNAMFNFVSSMKSRGIPIDGVGLQCHFTVSQIDFVKFDQNIKRYATVGLEAIITELDIKITNTNYTANSSLWLANQASDYANLLNICLTNQNAKTFVTWGFTDKYSWIPSFTSNTADHALVFDTNYDPKPAYTAMLTLLSNSTSNTAINDINNNPTLNLITNDGCVQIVMNVPMTSSQLYDLQGKCLFVSNEKTTTTRIAMNDKPNGVYILFVRTEDGESYNRKIIFKNLHK